MIQAAARGDEDRLKSLEAASHRALLPLMALLQQRLQQQGHQTVQAMREADGQAAAVFMRAAIGGNRANEGSPAAAATPAALGAQGGSTGSPLPPPPQQVQLVSGRRLVISGDSDVRTLCWQAGTDFLMLHVGCRGGTLITQQHLENLGISPVQLLLLAPAAGCDYDPAGVLGCGIVSAMAMARMTPPLVTAAGPSAVADHWIDQEWVEVEGGGKVQLFDKIAAALAAAQMQPVLVLVDAGGDGGQRRFATTYLGRHAGAGEAGSEQLAGLLRGLAPPHPITQDHRLHATDIAMGAPCVCGA